MAKQINNINNFFKIMSNICIMNFKRKNTSKSYNLSKSKMTKETLSIN